MHDKNSRPYIIYQYGHAILVFSASNTQDIYIWAICYYYIVVLNIWFINIFQLAEIK